MHIATYSGTAGKTLGIVLSNTESDVNVSLDSVLRLSISSASSLWGAVPPRLPATDFFGHRRDDAKPVRGPFASLSPGTPTVIDLWPLPSW